MPNGEGIQLSLGERSSGYLMQEADDHRDGYRPIGIFEQAKKTRREGRVFFVQEIIG